MTRWVALSATLVVVVALGVLLASLPAGSFLLTRGLV